MKKQFLILVAVLICSHISAQKSALENKYLNKSIPYAETIKAEDLGLLIGELASDAYEGRETGTEGNQKAAEFIAKQFKSYGIAPIPGREDYFQDVAFTRMRWSEIEMMVDQNKIQHQRDFIMVPGFNPSEDLDHKIDELTFAGYGIDDPAYSDYTGKDLKGKTLLVYNGEPKDKNEKYRISGSDEASEWSTDLKLKLEAAAKAGAKMLIVIDDKIRENAGKYRPQLVGGETMMGSPDQLGNAYPANVLLSPTIAQQMLGKKMKKVVKTRNKITKKGKSKSVSVPVEVNVKTKKKVNYTPGVNVLAYIEGSDPDLKDEVVVLSAHYDHVGQRGGDVYNGADDNASGTSAVIEIAHAFQMAKDKNEGPRRSVLCLLVTGEEKGLLGSQYYAEHPIFPLEKTVADINIDMIGRVDKHHLDNPNYVYVIGSDRLSTELHAINDQVNRQFVKLDLDYTYNAEDDPNRFYYRSDHYNFAKNGIPSIFFFSGVHEDYHRPTDTAEKIILEKATKIAKLAFYGAWEIANRDKRLEVDVIDGKKKEKGRS